MRSVEAMKGQRSGYQRVHACHGPRGVLARVGLKGFPRATGGGEDVTLR